MCREGTNLLKKHWTAVAQYLEDTPQLTAAAAAAAAAASPTTRVPNVSKALQKNAEKMLFCARNRAQVLKNGKQYPTTSAWVAALKKWDLSMKQLEEEAALLRKQGAEVLRGNNSQEKPVAAEVEVVATHRQWKRLVYALEPLVSQLEKRQKLVKDKQSSAFAVLLNKVGYELKQLTDKALLQLKELETQQLDYEKSLAEVEQENFRLLEAKFKTESVYMDSELRSYGPVSERCLDLVTKLFKLKTWQEHSLQLKNQLNVLQPLVVAISQTIVQQ
jgi:hypothetical protein